MKRFLLILAFFFVVFSGMILWWQYELTPVDRSDTVSKPFVIAQNAGSRIIGSNLQKEGLVRNGLVFLVYVKLSGLENTIQAGYFQLDKAMSLGTIANTLTHGTQDVWVTIPEGLRSEEIAQILQKKLPAYKPSWVFVLKQHEGYLFPDTYLFPKDATITDVLTIMTDNFKRKYALADTQRSVKLSENDVIILSSIVQREAITKNDMQLVASVLENRLAIGMALGSDVTLEYALGYQPQEKTWWKKDLTVNDLAIQSPYNTRLSNQLPPTPVSNPGLVAIEAVLNPPHTNYMYYVSDANGKLHFAVTLEQHNANVSKYE